MSRARQCLRLGVEGGAVTALYLLAAAWMTWPAALHLDEIIIGGGELGGWLWRQWWHATQLEALAASEDPLVQRGLTLVGLGRYPETGNILDIMLLAWPLQALFGLVKGYNLQVLLTLGINGLCGYILARSLVEDRLVALAAGLIAVVNPVCIQDVEASGLRQVLLWWLLLLPIPLRRAIEHQSALAAAAAGILLGLCAAFYWFYGLFAGILILIWLTLHTWHHRSKGRRALGELRWLGDLVLFAALITVPFATPYVLDEGDGRGIGRTAELPELTWGEDFPSHSELETVPLRPSSPEENLLSSLQRGLMSSWSPDWVLNPAHGRALPVAVFWLGLLPVLFHRRWRNPLAITWVVIFSVFYLGSLGPFLKPLGGQLDTAEVLRLGDEAIRMPWTWMFKWVPGMSRMFAPYRMGAVVVVASVALLAMGLAQVPTGTRNRRILAVVVGIATLLQVSWRWRVEPLPSQAVAPDRLVAPLEVAAFRVPDFYRNLPSRERAGIVELPLDQQQDLICFYQLHHGRKVYRSWASEAALPPLLRGRGGGSTGAELRFLAARDDHGPGVELALSELSRDPQTATLDAFEDEEFDQVLAAGGYRHLVVHERGYFLVDPDQGATLYELAVDKLASRLGIEPQEEVDLEWFDFPGNRLHGQQPARASWTASRIALHDDALPSQFRMAVFEVGDRVDGYEGEVPGTEAPTPAHPPLAHHQPGSGGNIVLVVVPGLPADRGGPGPEAAFVEGLGRHPSTRFAQAHAQTLSPYLGLGSLLTGRPASTLPLCSPLGGDPQQDINAEIEWCTQLPRTVTTLPQALSIHGYTTRAVVLESDPAGTSQRWDALEEDLVQRPESTADEGPRFTLIVVPDLALTDGADGPGLQDRARMLGEGVGQVLDAMDSASPHQEAWVMVTSTAGPANPETSGWIRLDQLRVPLLVFDPGTQDDSQEVTEVVQLLDVMPTVIGRAGGSPVQGLTGRDLLDGPGPEHGVEIYAESGDGLALRSGRWLLTSRSLLDNTLPLDPRVTESLLEHPVSDATHYQLHDIEADPDQEKNLVETEAETAEALRAMLIEHRRNLARPAQEVLTPERLRVLREGQGEGQGEGHN